MKVAEKVIFDTSKREWSTNMNVLLTPFGYPCVNVLRMKANINKIPIDERLLICKNNDLIKLERAFKDTLQDVNEKCEKTQSQNYHKGNVGEYYTDILFGNRECSCNVLSLLSYKCDIIVEENQKRIEYTYFNHANHDDFEFIKERKYKYLSCGKLDLCGDGFIVDENGKKLLNVECKVVNKISNSFGSDLQKREYDFVNELNECASNVLISFDDKILPCMTVHYKNNYNMHYKYITNNMYNLMTHSDLPSPEKYIYSFCEWCEEVNDKRVNALVKKAYKILVEDERVINTIRNEISDVISAFESMYNECKDEELKTFIEKLYITKISNMLDNDSIQYDFDDTIEIISKYKNDTYQCVIDEIVDTLHKCYKSMKTISPRKIDISTEHRTIGLYGITKLDIKDYGIFKSLNTKFIDIDTSKPLNEIECLEKGINVVFTRSSLTYPKLTREHLIFTLDVNTNTFTPEIVLLMALSPLPSFMNFIMQIACDNHETYMQEQINSTANESNKTKFERLECMIEYIKGVKDTITEYISILYEGLHA